MTFQIRTVQDFLPYTMNIRSAAYDTKLDRSQRLEDVPFDTEVI